MNPDPINENWRDLADSANKAYGEGRIAEAEEIYAKVLTEAEKAGEKDLFLALALNNLAAIYHTQGKYTLAEPLYKRSLDIKEEAYGGEHSDIALNLHNLALLYSARRMYPVAEDYYKKALAMREKLFGMESPELLSTLTYYAQLLKVLNRPVDMQLMQSRIKQISELQTAQS